MSAAGEDVVPRVLQRRFWTDVKAGFPETVVLAPEGPRMSAMSALITGQRDKMAHQSMLRDTPLVSDARLTGRRPKPFL